MCMAILYAHRENVQVNFKKSCTESSLLDPLLSRSTGAAPLIWQVQGEPIFSLQGGVGGDFDSFELLPLMRI